MGAASIGSIGLGASAAGGILGAIGAEKSGAATQQMYNYQAQVAKINSQIDQQNQEYALNQGEVEAQQYGMREAQTLGQIKVNQAASGIDVNSGSALAVQESERKVGAIDTNQIRTNAAKVAYDYDVKSVMDLNQENLDIMSGKNAKEAGDISALGSIIGGVSSVSTKWMQGSQMGMFSSGSSGFMAPSNVGIG